jgi:hypothetical protein
MRQFLTACLIATTAWTALPASARPDDERREGRERRKEWKEEDKADRRYWKERDKHERQYWKEREREGREHRAHRYDDEDRGHDRGRRQVAPPWMNGYWRPGDQRRYVALVPGDPSRMYVFLEGRWVLRQVRDPRARLDLEGAFHLPMAPPPIAPPRLGLDLHVVLFN